MSRPVVSIITPCYNAAETLPLALASVLAQTFEDWECIVIDDGSSDASCEVVERAGDPRIRLIRHDENRGRGAARQTGLDAARGEYLAMQDADDWTYPQKLEAQLAVMKAHPDLPLVSAGLAIFDHDHQIVGVQGCHSSRSAVPERQTMRRLGPPPVAHAPSLIRMTEARASGYDLALRFSEDMDFLIRILYQRPYVVLSEPLYAYAEIESITHDKVQSSLKCRKRIFGKYGWRYPMQRARVATETLGKKAIYASAASVGLFDRLIARRSRAPTVEETATFVEAKACVLARLRGTFGEQVAPTNLLRSANITTDLSSRV